MTKAIRCLLACFALAGISIARVCAAEIIVAPNPWVPESGKVALGNLADGMTFSGLPAEGELRIYAVDGALVRTISFTNGSGILRWDGKDEGGENAASGVYIWRFAGSGIHRSGKLLVVR